VSPSGRTIVITGATGLLGRACCRYFSARGWEVRAIVRRPDAARDLEPYATGGIYRGELPGNLDKRAFIGAPAAVVHSAYATEGRDLKRAAAINLDGTRAVRALASAHAAGRFVFVSSIAATPDAESFYARSKRQIEATLDTDRDLALRPGFIIGRGGLFARLCDAIRARPLVPLLYGGRQEIQTVWLEDVCRAIERALERELTGVLHVAHPDAVPIRRFYEAIASLVDRRCRFVRLPAGPLLVALRGAERLGVVLPISSENVLGLKHLRAVEVEPDLERLGLEPRSFAAALALLPDG
jgi:nucleoside-diphosphate-sugar epimerase